MLVKKEQGEEPRFTQDGSNAERGSEAIQIPGREQRGDFSGETSTNPKSSTNDSLDRHSNVSGSEASASRPLRNDESRERPRVPSKSNPSYLVDSAREFQAASELSLSAMLSLQHVTGENELTNQNLSLAISAARFAEQVSRRVSSAVDRAVHDSNVADETRKRDISSYSPALLPQQSSRDSDFLKNSNDSSHSVPLEEVTPMHPPLTNETETNHKRAMNLTHFQNPASTADGTSGRDPGNKNKEEEKNAGSWTQIGGAELSGTGSDSGSGALSDRMQQNMDHLAEDMRQGAEQGTSHGYTGTERIQESGCPGEDDPLNAATLKSMSKSCHACGHAPKNRRAVVCSKFAERKCRKIYCEKCLSRLFDEEKVLRILTQAEYFECMHCQSACPEWAQCTYYKRANAKRKPKQ